MFGGPAFLGQVRLVQVSASRGTIWWTHHILSTRAYLEAALAGDVLGTVAALQELWVSVLQWQRITRSAIAGALMGEHTVLAKLLINCFAQKSGSECTTTATAALMNNVSSQGMLFPVLPDVFASLFGQHVEITGAYITALSGGDQAAFESLFADALKNGEALSAFTDEVFGDR